MIRALLLSIIPSLCLADAFPQAAWVPGGIAEINLGENRGLPPRVFFHNNRVLVIPRQGQWQALVGIPLSTTPGMHEIQIDRAGKQEIFSFLVIDKHYPEQHLKIENKRLVDEMTPDDLKRIEAEKQLMENIKSVWSEGVVDTQFKAPVDGRLSSLFGLKRFFNEVPRNPHNGLDIAASAGTPILAPASGTIIGTGNFFFNGNTVFINHGQGLLSAYLHMTEIQVQNGQRVEQGQLLGTVGNTGRVTGPHLHWIVYLNKETVDPALFISEDIPRLAARNHP